MSQSTSDAGKGTAPEAMEVDLSGPTCGLDCARDGLKWPGLKWPDCGLDCGLDLRHGERQAVSSPMLIEPLVHLVPSSENIFGVSTVQLFGVGGICAMSKLSNASSSFSNGPVRAGLIGDSTPRRALLQGDLDCWGVDHPLEGLVGES